MDHVANDELFALVYEDLRRIAWNLQGSQGYQTLNPTALVNEAYVRLTRSGQFKAQSPEHLKHTVIRTVKFLVIEEARRKSAIRRGGGDIQPRRVLFDELSLPAPAFDPEELLALTEALDKLAEQNEKLALMLDYRYFGGLDVPEIASLLCLSEKKVQRSLRLARSFLAVTLRGNQENDTRSKLPH
jgi:RNA polymerase sigma factor (TIGR02999 family)